MPCVPQRLASVSTTVARGVVGRGGRCSCACTYGSPHPFVSLRFFLFLLCSRFACDPGCRSYLCIQQARACVFCKPLNLTFVPPPVWVAGLLPSRRDFSPGSSVKWKRCDARIGSSVAQTNYTHTGQRTRILPPRKHSPAFTAARLPCFVTIGGGRRSCRERQVR